MKKISVIVPIWNVEKYIRRCIDSIINQSYENLEIILVDDGSPDNCPAICDEYAEKDSRIKVIHKENGGLSSARNAGLDIATGDYIGFVDSDDFIHKDFYKILLEECEKNECDIMFCDIQKNENISNSKKIEIFSKNILLDDYLEKKRLYNYHVFNKIYKKKIFYELRFSNTIAEDVNIKIDFLLLADKIGHINIPMYYYCQDNVFSITHNIKKEKLYQITNNLHVIEKIDKIREYKNKRKVINKLFIRVLSLYAKMMIRKEYTAEDCENKKNEIINFQQHFDKNNLNYISSVMYVYFKTNSKFFKLSIIIDQLFRKL